ncbi:MAG: glycoside hydrolase family 2 TIM barrel-domain containing protein [Terriglobales bacterium]
MYSRRRFLTLTGAVTAGTLSPTALSAVDERLESALTETFSLSGRWQFRTDPLDSGAEQRWYEAEQAAMDWQSVDVPHTWQIDPAYADYRGIAWYRKSFDVPATWQLSAVRVEFEAVFHTATVWVNGRLAGEHNRKGYTAFTLDITQLLEWGRENTVAVRVDSAFNEHMLPRGRSSDWAHDGGVYRPVQLIITPKTFVERVDVKAVPDLTNSEARVTISARIRNAGSKRWEGHASYRIVDEGNGVLASSHSGNSGFSIPAGGVETVLFHGLLRDVKLWHFDQPNLYRLKFSIADERESHQFTTMFGVRTLEVKDGQFHLNGEHVRLIGVERMAGSNPEFGMAEPEDWIQRDHADMRHLNCIFTRVHWPQDKRVLEYCDRHGILMQIEVPAWGPDTFQGMGDSPDADIMQNGLEQLQEVIARDRNHPCIVVWGLCNEIDGQNPAAYQFAKRMLEEAKRLDDRLCSYASNSLFQTPERDVAGLMDFIETNEYFGSWEPGSPEDLARHLEDLHAAFPGKPLVISEYGYCACTEDRPEGDERRTEILRAHDGVIRSKDYMGGAIFFCYNDYRTHVGDRGVGALKQRVHGVVDLYGRPKRSYEVLRVESSPIELVTVENRRNAFSLLVRTRHETPRYTLRHYKLRGVLYGQGDIPVEKQDANLPEIGPGAEVRIELPFAESITPVRVRFDVLRPGDVSAYSLDWKPMG